MLLDDRLVNEWEAQDRSRPSRQPRAKARGPLAIDAAEFARRRQFLDAEGQIPTLLEEEALLGTNDLVDSSFLYRCLRVCRTVCKIQGTFRGRRGMATGVLVAPGILLTNHHVLGEEAEAAGAEIEMDLRRNVAGSLFPTTIFRLDAAKFHIANRDLDYCLVAVAPRSTDGAKAIEDYGYARLHPQSGKVREGEFVTIIQHPNGSPLQIALRENEVDRAEDGEPFIYYHADTAPGSSGAPVFNDSFQIAALHSRGVIRRNKDGHYALARGGFAVSIDGLRETDVIWEHNAGVRVSRICADALPMAFDRSPEVARKLELAMAGGDVLSLAVVDARTHSGRGETIVNASSIELTRSHEEEADVSAEGIHSPAGRQVADNPWESSTLSVPIAVRVSVAYGRVGVALPHGLSRVPQDQPSDLETEAHRFQIPVIYDGLESREGFDRDYLGQRVEMIPLTQAGRAVAAPLKVGPGHELRYHKFSVLMHAERRLALFTASNVDFRRESREVNGKRFSRGELTEIPKDVLEQWVTDSRIDAKHQLPDVFYSDDRGAFDKGHLVRRDDVCWGTSFEDIQMANGDTYHVTNCSPQIRSFNQAPHGDFNWGDFENEIQKRTSAERVSIFAGPVLARNDRWFRGRDDTGTTRLQVPRRYWKVVVARDQQGLGAYGFVFAQDVTAITEKEFAVSAAWRHRHVPLTTLDPLVRGWLDLAALRAIDRHPDAQ